MIKVYEIRGVVECSRVFRIGKLTVRCDFSGGAVNESGIVPAVYSTNNPMTQAIIENSESFKRGYVNIQTSIKEASDSVNIADKNDPKEKEVNETKVTTEINMTDGKTDYPDVKNSNMAKEVLMNEPYKIPLSELTNKATIQTKASELNVTFSNWN